MTHGITTTLLDKGRKHTLTSLPSIKTLLLQGRMKVCFAYCSCIGVAIVQRTLKEPSELWGVSRKVLLERIAARQGLKWL